MRASRHDSIPSEPVGTRFSAHRGRRGATALLALLLSASTAAAALAGSTPTVSATNNSRLHTSILVSAQGRTLYVLNPETTHHLLCTSHSCLSTWPPFTASAHAKLTEGGGAHGTLGLLRRSGGTTQVTLNGQPLYYFSGDSKRGEANGEGLASFGGTWHALLASGRPR